MSYQIVKKLRSEGGEVRCMMHSNNVWPKTPYEWKEPDTVETRNKVRRFLLDRVWHPTIKDTRFIRELGLRYNPSSYSYEEV